MPQKLTTLKSSADFQRISKLGKRSSFPGFILQALRKEGPAPFRFGLTVSRKVGNAVMRNRVKRRLREIIRLSGAGDRLEGWEIVLIGRTAGASLDFTRMQQDFALALRNVGAEG